MGFQTFEAGRQAGYRAGYAQGIEEAGQGELAEEIERLKAENSRLHTTLDEIWEALAWRELDR